MGNIELGNLIFGNSRGLIPLERDEWQDVIVDALESCGFDGYGHIEDQRLKRFIDCSMFCEHVSHVVIGDYEIMPYYWGNDENIAAYDNFIDHKHNLSVQWYKYPLRDSYANREITFEEWQAIFKEFSDYVNARLAEIPEIT